MKVSLTSDLKRKEWMRKGMVQAASKSFFNGLTGTSKDAIVYQAKKADAKAGHTVVFDYDGNLSGRAVKGKNKAYGSGEEKRKFSDKLTVERYRLVADNGDKFDGVEIGDLSINEHSDSRSKLADLYVRFKDQALFDVAQGVRNTTPTHTIDLGTTFDYNTLVDIETTIKTSQGFTVGGIRRPITPFRLHNGEGVWMFVIDRAMSAKLKKSSGFQAIMQSADVRGQDNRLIKGVLGKIGSLLIVEADNFFGTTDGTSSGFDLDESSIEISGLRQYDGGNPGTALWTGQTGFDYSSANLHSRGLVLGASALQIAMGKMPDYKFQESQDFAITAESALEVWMEVAKTNLTLESSSDYAEAKVTNLDLGVIAVDLAV